MSMTTDQVVRALEGIATFKRGDAAVLVWSKEHGYLDIEQITCGADGTVYINPEQPEEPGS